MRDLAGCFATQAVRVASAACSEIANSSPVVDPPPVVDAVVCTYRTVLSTKKELLTRLTWSKATQPGFAIDVVQDGDRGMANPLLLQRKKGTRRFAVGDSAVMLLHWDISDAKRGCGPEPAKDFYLVLVADGELALLLGDHAYGEATAELDGGEALPVAEFSEVSRSEQVSGGAGFYSATARFGDGGERHEIAIRCKAGGADAEEPEVQVAVDRKVVVAVRRLRWNFRGNQAIFVDGSTIDVMWDVHDWWFGGGESDRCARFVFRRRKSVEQRVWLDEEGTGGFFLLIQQAFNT